MTRIPTLLLGIAILAATTSLSAQWPRYPTPGPKNPDGKLALNGPTPRTPDGKPDPSGVWETIQGARGGGPKVAAEETGELPPSGSIFGNVGDQTPGGAPYQPWAAEICQEAHRRQQQGQSRRALPAHGRDADDIASVSEEDHPDAPGARGDS